MDSRKRVERAAKDIGACLEPSSGTPQDLQGVYIILKIWYCHASARAPNSMRLDTEKVTRDYTKLYQREDPTTPVRKVPTHVTPFRINNDVQFPR